MLIKERKTSFFLGKNPTHRLDKTAITAATEYSMNFRET